MADQGKLDSLSLDDLEYTMLVDNPTNILVVDDEDVIRMVFDALLAETPYQIGFADSAEKAISLLESEQEFNLLIVDKNLPGENGLDLMRKVRDLRPEAEFIMITGYASYESAVEALRLGAFDYLEKPFNDLVLVREKIDRALDRQRLAHENVVLADQLRAVHKDLRSKSTALSLCRDVPGDAASLERQVRDLHTKMAQAAETLRQAHGRYMALVDNQLIPKGPHADIQKLLEQAWAYLASELPDDNTELLN